MKRLVLSILIFVVSSQVIAEPVGIPEWTPIGPRITSDFATSIAWLELEGEQHLVVARRDDAWYLQDDQWIQMSTLSGGVRVRYTDILQNIVIDGHDTLVAYGYFGRPGESSVLGLGAWRGDHWELLGDMPEGFFPYARKALAYTSDDISMIVIQTESDIRVWDGEQWSILLTGDIRGVAVYDDGTGPELYCSGSFTLPQTTESAKLAKWDGTRWEMVVFPCFDNSSLGQMATADSPSRQTLYIERGSFGGLYIIENNECSGQGLRDIDNQYDFFAYEPIMKFIRSKTSGRLFFYRNGIYHHEPGFRESEDWPVPLFEPGGVIIRDPDLSTGYPSWNVIDIVGNNSDQSIFAIAHKDWSLGYQVWKITNESTQEAQFIPLEGFLRASGQSCEHDEWGGECRELFATARVGRTSAFATGQTSSGKVEGSTYVNILIEHKAEEQRVNIQGVAQMTQPPGNMGFGFVEIRTAYAENDPHFDGEFTDKPLMIWIPNDSRYMIQNIGDAAVTIAPLDGEIDGDIIRQGRYSISFEWRTELQLEQSEASSLMDWSLILSPLATTCRADLTEDGLLDFFDVSAFLDAFGAEDPAADFTADGLFDFFDVSAFLDFFGEGCPLFKAAPTMSQSSSVYESSFLRG